MAQLSVSCFERMNSPTHRPLSRSDVFVVAIWFALASGFAQAVLLGVERHVLRLLTEWNPQSTWLAPTTNAVLFAVLAVLLTAAARSAPRLATLPAVAGVFAFLAFANLLLLYPRVNQWAAALLAAGLAVQLARMVATRSDAFLRAARIGIGVLAPILALLGLAAGGLPSGRGSPANVSASPRSVGRPNVLLLVLDTVRAQSLSVYGFGEPTTPTLEAVGRDGVVFDLAIAPAPWTLPSHASLLTGRWPHELSAGWRTPLDATFPTLPEVLAAEGYRTGAFVSNVIFASAETGLKRGFDHYADFTISLGEALLSSPLAAHIANSGRLRCALDYHDVLGRKRSADVNAEFLRWRASVDGPWMALLNYNDAHEPYLPPPPFAETFGSAAPRKLDRIALWRHEGARLGKLAMTRQEAQAEQDAYESAVASIDHGIGLLLDELRLLGVLDNTIVVVTSDHGEEFGQHPGLFTHGNNLYLTTLRVPLIVRAPERVPAGLRVPAAVSIRDIPATIAGLLGVSAASRFPGASLARYWSQDAVDDAEHAIVSTLQGDEQLSPGGDKRSILLGRYHYIKTNAGEELYAFDVDPEERRNLVADPGLAEVVAHMRGVLAAMIRSAR